MITEILDTGMVQAIKMTGSKGNGLPERKNANIRKATAAEIRKFVNGFKGILILEDE